MEYGALVTLKLKMQTVVSGVSEILCVRRAETFPRCCLPKVPLDRRQAARWESRWSFYPRASKRSA